MHALYISRQQKARNNPGITSRIAFLLLLILASACNGQQPPNSAGSWPISTPEEQGMDSHELLNMLENIEENHYNLHSLLVVRNGVLVLGAYYPPFTPRDKHLLFSSSKSITSTLVGIALKEGKIQSIDQAVVDFFAGTRIRDLDNCKQNIHIDDLLNMTSGLVADDYAMGESTNWSQFAIDQPCITEPGTEFNYNTGNTQLLSAIVQIVTGKTASDYAREKLFEPLGIYDTYWLADPSGTSEGGNGLMLTPGDMAKIGVTYLNNGVWQDQQIVPAEWVQASTQEDKSGLALPWGEPMIGYINQWWHTTNGYTAAGYGGQFIYIIPSLDVVVVSTAGLPMDKQAVILDLVDDFVLKAIISDQPLPKSAAATELADRLTAIANPKAETPPELPAIASSLSGKTIQMDENPLGWKTLRLDFKGADAWLTVTTTGSPQESKFAIGMDGLFRKTAQKAVKSLSIAEPEQRHINNPFEFNFLLGAPVDGDVYMKGQWVSDSRFFLTVQDNRDFDLDLLRFIFTSAGASIVWDSLVDGEGILTLKGAFE